MWLEGVLCQVEKWCPPNISYLSQCNINIKSRTSQANDVENVSIQDNAENWQSGIEDRMWGMLN